MTIEISAFGVFLLMVFLFPELLVLPLAFVGAVFEVLWNAIAGQNGKD